MTDTKKDFLPQEEHTPDLNVDDNVAGSTHLNDEMTSEDELSRMHAEVASWKDKYARLMAEFENYKKRSFREKMDVIQTGSKDVMMSMLDVLDDTLRAEKQMETATNVEAVREGMLLVFNKLKQVLQQKGLKPFDSIGHEFDVEKHEAVTEIPAPTPELAGKVVDELHKGYYLNDKLIRHAKVVIGKGADA